MNLRKCKLWLRKVREEDSRLLWQWANDPEVREGSFSPAPIPWDKHIDWFKNKQDDPRCIFLLALNEDDEPAGQVRFDINDHETIISISLSKKYRGKGYGSDLIRAASEKLFEIVNVDTITAYIKHSNKASIRAFKKSGYTLRGMSEVNRQKAIKFIFDRAIE